MTPQQIHAYEQESAAISDITDQMIAVIPLSFLASLHMRLHRSGESSEAASTALFHPAELTFIYRCASDRIQQYMTRKITEVQQ